MASAGPLYRRNLIPVGSRMLIESTCANCGHRIVGSVGESLLEDERDHADRCPKRYRGSAESPAKSPAPERATDPAGQPLASAAVAGAGSDVPLANPPKPRK